MTITTNVDLLDHGYCRLIEGWGSDQRIIEAARMSTDKGFMGWGPDRPVKCILCNSVAPSAGVSESPCVDTAIGEPPRHDYQAQVGDEKLLRYLYEHQHSTPFEMAGLVIEVQAPIFVFRQWHRHRTQSYNEMSARYTPLPDKNYIPTVARLMADSSENKQAGTIAGAGELTSEEAEHFRSALQVMYKAQEDMYQHALEAGVPKELARIHLPGARYSRMRAQANLRNWLAFLTLRMDSHAQHEIQVYAVAVGTFIKTKFPRTWDLFVEGVS